ncbi:hypothetical protein J2W28_004874, partial [Variovorax boronicumulans]|nr:hypothetical protein [Variovorax boronicumulans]
MAADADVEVDDEGELLGERFALLRTFGGIAPSPSGGGLGWGQRRFYWMPRFDEGRRGAPPPPPPPGGGGGGGAPGGGLLGGPGRRVKK